MNDQYIKKRSDLRLVNLWLVITSAIVIIFAIAIAALAMYVLLDLGDILEIIPSQLYRNGAYLATFSGIFLIVICFLAISAVVDTNRFSLILACGLYFIIIVLLIIAAIFILTFNISMDNTTVMTMQDSLVNWYNRTSLISRAWDQTQSRLRCCAVSNNGWLLYRSSYWSNITNRNEYFPAAMTEMNSFFLLVPESCCYTIIDGITGWPTATFIDLYTCQHFQFGPPRLIDGAHNTAVYYRGCFNAIKSYIGHFSGWLGGLCLISIVPLLLAAISIIRLLRAMREIKTD